MVGSSRIKWLPRWRERRQGRRYRTYLLEGNVLVRSAPLLPHLERLPLLVRPLESPAAQPLIEAVNHASRMRLISSVSSGRRLVLRQICLQWAQGRGLPQQRIPLLLTFQAGIKPLDLIARELAVLGFEHDTLLVKRSLASGMWLLLFEGWEDLPAADQQQWAGWFNAIAERYPMLALVVASETAQPGWPLFEDWTVTGWESTEVAAPLPLIEPRLKQPREGQQILI